MHHGPSRARALSVLFLLALVARPPAAQEAPEPQATSGRYAEDFDAFWRFVDEEYAYFDQKQTDWQRVRSLYGPEAAAAADDRAFLNVLERAVGELYDAHAGFNANNRASPRLVPSDTDLWAEWHGDRAVVTSVRAGSNAEAVGLRPGAVVSEIEGRSVTDAAQEWMPRTLRGPDPAARDWALRTALAGTHAGPVRLVADMDGKRGSFEFTPGVPRPGARLTVDTLGRGIGYVRIHNSLGDNGLVADVDSALAVLRDTRALILDLRDTPSGGNTTVARGIMSRLVGTEQPYQRHELVAEERAYGVRRIWVEHVAPRGPFTYARPVVVLVGRWTGSMGEGLAIGLDGMGRATVVGTPMARLLGAISGRELPNTRLVIRVPTERLTHVDGTPREAFVPPVGVAPGRPGADVALERGVDLLLRTER